MQKNLATVCEEMRDEISSSYDMGPGDAEELFKAIWRKLTGGPLAGLLAVSVEKVTEAFDI